MMPIAAATRDLQRTVQFNCDVSDATYAGEYTLCIYLLKMREYHGWLHGLDADAPIDRRDLGNWVLQQEQKWRELEGREFQQLRIEGDKYDIFDHEGVNARLNPLGLVYSAGLGRLSIPVFFLGRLEANESTESVQILVSSKELARGIAAPPAMSQGRRIIVRKDAFRRYLQTMVEEWGWRQSDNAMGRVLRKYGYDKDAGTALERMLENELESVILHEIGEVVASELMGQGWQEMLSNISNPAIEMKVRAVRDNLADCASALPALLNGRNPASVHFYFASLSSLRRTLLPTICNAYERASGHENFCDLNQLVRNGKAHWLEVSQQLIRYSRQYGRDSDSRIGEYLAQCAL